MIIKILGTGCPNCIALYNVSNKVITDLNITAELIKIEDFSEISRYNIMSTPALVINDEVVGVGKLNYKKVKKIVEKYVE